MLIRIAVHIRGEFSSTGVVQDTLQDKCAQQKRDSVSKEAFAK